MATVSFEGVKAQTVSSDTWLLDRHGEPLHRLRTDTSVRRGQWVALADISPALRAAMVLSEDKRFYEHSGVDWKAVSAAAWSNMLNQRTRGASTLSMQLASLVEDGPRAGNTRRGWVGKTGQALSATLIEREWRKDQILEAYLNLVPFRGELQGIDAVSRTLFDKAPHGLNAQEAAITAALVRAPNAKASVVAERACGVLKAMQFESTPTASPASIPKSMLTAPADCAVLDALTTGVLQRKAWAPSDGIAPHLAQQLLGSTAQQGNHGKPVGSDKQNPARSLRSSLDARIQRHATASLQQHLRELHGRNVQDGAVVVLDNASGQVLAYVGSSGELGAAQEVDAAAALRQAGSTLKPFLYAQAIAEKRVTAASLLEDSSTHIPTASGLYIPQNYDRSFKGWVSVRTALGASLNVPAVRALVMVSPDSFAKQLRSVGLPLKNEGDFYGYSLALGSADVSLLSLTNAYRTLANGGRYSALNLRNTVTTPDSPSAKGEQVMDPRAAFIVSDILSDTNARARTFGTDNVLGTRFWTAVKTGTSKDMRDNWALGYSSRYTVGVWVGNADGSSMWDVSGTSGAAPVWASVMRYLHDGQGTRGKLPSVSPTPPAGLAQIRTTYQQGQEAGRTEWYLSGTAQPARVEASTDSPSQNAMILIASQAISTGAIGQNNSKTAAAPSSGSLRITHPANGSIVALDPDIPPLRQRVQLRSDALVAGTAHAQSLQWLINGQPTSPPMRGSEAQWMPWPGKYRISLADTQGRSLDEITLEVRGAAVLQSAQSPKVSSRAQQPQEVNK